MTKVLPCTALFKTSLKSLFKRAAAFSATLLALIYISSPLSAAVAAPAPAGFDILGMKLGMSVAQIEAAIRAYDPSLTIVVTKHLTNDQRLGDGNYVQWVQAQRANPQDPYKEEISAGFTVAQPGRAFYVGRHTDFHPAQRPLADQTVQQLRAKYGPESVSSNGDSFYWAFDKGGKQLVAKTPTQLSRTCPQTFAYGGAAGSISTFGVPRFSPACGIDLSVILGPVPGTKLLFRLSEQLMGDSMAVDDIQKLMAEATAAQGRQRQQQEQKASGVRPAL